MRYPGGHHRAREMTSGESVPGGGAGHDRPVGPRLAIADDAGALFEFNQAMALETESRSLDPQTLKSGIDGVLNDRTHGFYVVADTGREIAGALLVTCEWSDWRNGWFWWIQSVYVRPAHRRRGIYRMLHGYVIDSARCAGDVVGVRLYVEKANFPAQRTYASMGMHETAYRMYEQMLR